ncbi:helix-turn-helix domain-containing protein [Herbiconiux sp. CPCC 203386]|uniref:Helix-turn-helix domain-containing protein n=2 Tax=Herbiconiux daphne TaxID=2970914 RepID=A0ABT2GY72_9MICO|nr:helix-turn-helix domain-containing protein [Herbiconiux daphne]
MPPQPSGPVEDDYMLDSLTIGRRIRQLRSERGLTLDDLGAAIGRAPSQVSVIENGRRELKLGELQRFATVFDVSIDQLLSSEPPTRRAALEIALERAQRGPLFASLNLPALPVRKSLSDDAIKTILGLHRELERIHGERAATPEEARRANTELRRTMRRRHNYFADLEQTAASLHAAVGHAGGPLSQRLVSDLASHLGFTLHYVGDLPGSTRSVTDLRNGRIYVPLGQSPDADPRSVVLQALSSHVLRHAEPRDYAEFLQQRVETNYLAAALLIPESGAVGILSAAKDARELSVEDLRDAFGVSYETAAHRFTNLATHHLDIPVHFLKVHENGTLSKAYENDNVTFPTDALGSVEGQTVCRFWSARRVFDVEDRFSPYHQYTDKPTGTYWCTSRIQAGATGQFSVSVGTAFAHAKWFRGRDTANRFTSTCPDESCCRRPPEALAAAWAGQSHPSARLNSSLLAAMPTSGFTGVDTTEVFEFLDRHAPGA